MNFLVMTGTYYEPRWLFRESCCVQLGIWVIHVTGCPSVVIILPILALSLDGNRKISRSFYVR